MATAVWCELVCDKCAKRDFGLWAFGNTVPRKELKEEGKSRGWRFHSNHAFCSRKCESDHLIEEAAKEDVL
jgi:hypothetical protein